VSIVPLAALIEPHSRAQRRRRHNVPVRENEPIIRDDATGACRQEINVPIRRRNSRHEHDEGGGDPILVGHADESPVHQPHLIRDKTDGRRNQPDDRAPD